VDEQGFDDTIPGDELAAVARALAELGAEPLPGAVATRLDARLARELGSVPLAARRSRRRRLRIGGALTGATAVAAAIVFALGSGGGGHPARPEAANALRTTAASVATDAAGASAPSATTAMKLQAPAAKSCAPASRRAGARPRAGCPGARGGHARAV
jgi:hypothetical protein